MTNQPLDLPNDEKLAELAPLLDRYLDAFNRRSDSESTEILTANPELLPFVECVEHLQTLAEAVAEGSGDPQLSPTLLQEDVQKNSGISSRADSSSVRPTPFSTFGKYELREELGRGGMGVVYRARQTDLDRDVAIKMILASQFASSEEIRRFYAEAKAAGRLHHPHIVGIHEVGEVHGQPFFAMDHVDGQSLAESLRTGPMTCDRAARTLSLVARAVNYLHENGIIHRDLKPSNILLDVDEAPFVTDFGLAKVFSESDSETQTGTILGTPSYMAPEQAAGRISQVSNRSDIYSLGAILFEMLTGRPPFKENTPLDTLVQVLEGEPSLPSRLNPSVPRDLERICLHCLEKDPQNRYSSAAELADDLERFLRKEPVKAQATGLVSLVHRWVRREPVLVSHLAGLTFAVLIVQISFVFHSVEFRTAWWNYHLKIMGTLGIWMSVSFFFQWLLNRENSAEIARPVWMAADVILMTTILCLTSGPPGPLLIGYPLLVACAGLFFEVRLVLFTTIVTLISYAGLIVVRPDETVPRHYPIIFAAVLAVVGCVVAYQVYRVRVLSRYYEQRR